MTITPVCQAIEQRKIKVSYAVPCPLFIAKDGYTSALDTAAYTVSTKTVVSVSTVQDEYRSVIVEVNSDLVGTETITITGLIDTLGNEVESGAIAITYPSPAPIFSGNGAFLTNVSNSEASIRKGLNPALDGVNVRALIVGLANGEAFNKRNNRLAIAQSYIATASGSFLDSLGSGYGVERPPLLGLDDESYRFLLTSLSTGSQTNKVMWDILRAFYGVQAVHAYLAQELPGTNPTGLTDVIQVDDVQVSVTYQASDFITPATPTPQEIAIVLNRYFRNNNLTAVAQKGVLWDGTDFVECLEIYSGSYGLRSRIGVVTGGYLTATGVRTIYSDGALNASVVSYSGPLTMDVVLPASSAYLSRGVKVGWYGSDSDASPVIEIPDGYSVDPALGYSVLDKTVELAQDLYPSAYYEYVSVAANGTIDPAGGHLIFNFGTDGSAVVRYLSYDSTTNKLRLDPSAAFPVRALSGSDVYLVQMSPVDSVAGLGLSYVSDTVSSKVYAEQFIREYAAAGMEVNVTISYPDDYKGIEFVYG